MKRKLPVIIYNRMPRIGPALKTDNNVRLLRQHIRDLSFSFIAPIGAYHCFYHLFSCSFRSVLFPVAALAFLFSPASLHASQVAN